jgi:hypothetical protein
MMVERRRERDYTGAKSSKTLRYHCGSMPAMQQQIRFCTSHDGVRIAYATSDAGDCAAMAFAARCGSLA